MRGVVNVFGAWLKILHARFARIWLSTYLPQILDTPLYTVFLLKIWHENDIFSFTKFLEVAEKLETMFNHLGAK